MKTNRNFRYNIVFFMIFLIVTIPFYVSNVYASVDTNSGIKEITGYAVADSSGMDPGEACSDKVEKTNSYVELLENDVVVVIEEVLRKAYAICTIMSAIELILSALGVFPGNAACDASAWCPVVYLAAVCKILCWVHKIFGYIYETPLIGGKSLCQIIACSWCPVSAWDNIYSGMGCLCLSSVLFNLRKLKVIYDTYGACTEAACRDGISTEGCEQGFCEEECKYWKGTRASFFTQLMTIIVTWAIMRFILNKYSQMLKTWANLVEVPLLLLSLYSGWQYVTYEFSEVSADDFNFKNLYQDRDPMSSTIDIGKSNYKGKQIKRMSITKYREENPDYAKYGIGEKDTGTVTTYGNEKIVVVNKKGFGGTNKYFKDGNGKEYVNRNGRVIKMENIRFKSFKNVEVDGKKYDVTMDEHGNVKSAKSGGKDVSLTKDKKAELQKSVEKENDESQNIRRGKGPLAKQHDAQVVRQAVSVVVGYIIGKWMQDGVEDQCKKECESSEPSEDLMAGDTTGIVMDCEGRSTTTGTAQFTITDYDIEYRYDYSFTLESCRQDITYSVYMRGDSEKVLASGTLAVGSREVNTDGFYGTDNYVQICIQTDDDLFGYHGLACFPVLSE
ncbi:MAG: hypothetical protein KAU20_02930, partial [Nanoarchaeota archaeon]|nr:hypothetical protein [Nanoarchaeota archaeon]